MGIENKALEEVFYRYYDADKKMCRYFYKDHKKSCKEGEYDRTYDMYAIARCLRDTFFKMITDLEEWERYKEWETAFKKWVEEDD